MTDRRFTIWAATQHSADFAVQIAAAAGRTPNDPEFFEEAAKAVQHIALAGRTAASSLHCGPFITRVQKNCGWFLICAYHRAVAGMDRLIDPELAFFDVLNLLEFN